VYFYKKELVIDNIRFFMNKINEIKKEIENERAVKFKND
jgi:hypothetical protein